VRASRSRDLWVTGATGTGCAHQLLTQRSWFQDLCPQGMGLYMPPGTLHEVITLSEQGRQRVVGVSSACMPQAAPPSLSQAITAIGQHYHCRLQKGRQEPRGQQLYDHNSAGTHRPVHHRSPPLTTAHHQHCPLPLPLHSPPSLPTTAAQVLAQVLACLHPRSEHSGDSAATSGLV
jgi:hypothetical protein